MSISRIKTLAVVLAVAAAANAQFHTPSNARTTALANAPLSDIRDIYAYPVLLMGYLNQAQVTWNAEGRSDEGLGGGSDMGTVFLTKSFGDMFALGIVANQGTLLSNAGGPISEAFSALPNEVPHILLGIDLGTLKIGADIFIEYASDNSEVVETTPAEDYIYTTTIKDYHRTMNAGARLSADVALGDMGLLAKIGIGLPSYYDESSASGYPPPLPNGTFKTNSKKGLYFESGAEVSYPLSTVDLTGGIEYTFANYQPYYDAAVPVPNITPEYWHSLFRFYVNGELNIFETAAAVVSYELSRVASTTTNTTPALNNSPEVKRKTTDGELLNTFYIGVEKTWDKAWKFDSFTLRSGTNYEIAWNFRNTSENRYNDKTHRAGPADHNYVKPVIGAGVSKGPLTIDAALNFGRLFEDQEKEPDYYEWRGPLTSPAFAVATATMKF
jgi:hypothetical protein